MFSKNLKFYRLRNSMTKKELAEKINISPMAVTHYEQGDRKPDMEMIKKMAEVLGVKVSDFLAVRNERIAFCHGEFRKNSKLTNTQQEFIRESVEEYFNRFMTIVEILGGEILPDALVCGSLGLADDHEKNALSLRRHLGLADDGPISDMVEMLENKGILVYVCGIGNDDFSGMNGFVDGRPYIAINSNMSPERNRSTIAHELAHLMFEWSEELDDKVVEELATAISGAFLLPRSDVVRELGIRRRRVSKDMCFVAQEYGISMFLLVKRAQMLGIISESAAKEFYINASKECWRRNEPSRIGKEIPILFEQLVYRAINEDEISIQKGAELLNSSYDDVYSRCCFSESN
ncbi:MAG: XRE family transcriptional regulator [Prolixibacteraceae bacterium]|nr:XRE family transcriptional regulator [Prolixibacteraceae bacterium]